jgi:hypothetical protein
MSQLDLKLPQNSNSTSIPKKAGNSLAWKSFVSAGIVVAALGAWWPHLSPPPKTKTMALPPMAGPQQHQLPFSEDLLLKLKKAGAWTEAAKLLDTALAQKDLSNLRLSQLLFQQADLFSNASQYSSALERLYRAEMTLGKEDEDLARKIERAIIDNLRNMGRFDAISDELAAKNRERRDGEATVKDPTVALVDGEALSLSDFRKVVDREIEQRLRQMQAQGQSPKELETARTELQKQYSAPGEQYRLLQQWISTEVLVREAELWKLEQHPEYASAMQQFRRQLLAQLLMEQQLKLEPISDSDLNNYMETHRADIGLSTDGGQLSPEDLANAKPKAEKLYSQIKLQEKQQAFQKDLMSRHKVEVIREAFTEGAR